MLCCKVAENCRVWQGLKAHLNSSYWPLLYYFIGSSNDDLSIINDPCTATVSVKIVGTTFVFSLTQCLCTRFWFNCNKQHWEGEETGEKEKTVSSGSVPTISVWDCSHGLIVHRHPGEKELTLKGENSHYYCKVQAVLWTYRWRATILPAKPVPQGHSF